MSLDLDPNRAPVPTKDAATLILLRENDGCELFCVQRSRQSAFMGGAIVFPGGKVDAADADPAWDTLSTEPRSAPFANDARHLRALAIAACRESLEEAALLPTVGSPLDDAELALMRKEPFHAAVAKRGLVLDLAALHPLSRWITPTAEARRYDARFFMMVAPEGQSGAHDEHETVSSFWASPKDILLRWEKGDVELFPPTHATIALLAECAHVDDAIALAGRACLDPIQPAFTMQYGPIALALPGDRAHEVKERRLPSTATRYVYRDGRMVPE